MRTPNLAATPIRLNSWELHETFAHPLYYGWSYYCTCAIHMHAAYIILQSLLFKRMKHTGLRNYKCHLCMCLCVTRRCLRSINKAYHLIQWAEHKTWTNEWFLFKFRQEQEGEEKLIRQSSDLCRHVTLRAYTHCVYFNVNSWWNDKETTQRFLSRSRMDQQKNIIMR